MDRTSYCKIHDTCPADGEPCWQCINKALNAQQPDCQKGELVRIVEEAAAIFEDGIVGGIEVAKGLCQQKAEQLNQVAARIEKLETALTNLLKEVEETYAWQEMDDKTIREAKDTLGDKKQTKGGADGLD